MSLPLRAKVLAKRAQLRHFFEGGLWIFKQDGTLHETVAADDEGVYK